MSRPSLRPSSHPEDFGGARKKVTVLIQADTTDERHTVRGTRKRDTWEGSREVGVTSYDTGCG